MSPAINHINNSNDNTDNIHTNIELILTFLSTATAITIMLNGRTPIHVDLNVRSSLEFCIHPSGFNSRSAEYSYGDLT